MECYCIFTQKQKDIIEIVTFLMVNVYWCETLVFEHSSDVKEFNPLKVKRIQTKHTKHV